MAPPTPSIFASYIQPNYHNTPWARKLRTCERCGKYRCPMSGEWNPRACCRIDWGWGRTHQFASFRLLLGHGLGRHPFSAFRAISSVSRWAAVFSACPFSNALPTPGIGAYFAHKTPLGVRPLSVKLNKMASSAHHADSELTGVA